MAFWNDPLSLSIKQSHRWVISFSILNEDKIVLPAYAVKTIDRPTYEIGYTQAKYLYAHTYNFPKRLAWKPIGIVLYDVSFDREQLSVLEDPKVSGNRIIGTPHKKTKSSESIIYYFMQKFGYYPPKEAAVKFKEESPAYKSYHFKDDMIRALLGETKNEFSKKGPKVQFMQIYEIDGDGSIIDNWKLYNPFITDFKPDKLDYSTDAPLTISFTISYDWAELGGRLFGEDKPKPVIPPPAPPPPAPAKVAPPASKPPPLVQPDKITFEFNKAELTEQAKAELNKIIPKLKESSDKIYIKGYTDTVGTEDYNLNLSQRRANSVQAYLKDQGVDESKFDTVRGFGETSQIKGTDAENRRVVITLDKPNK